MNDIKTSLILRIKLNIFLSFEFFQIISYYFVMNYNMLYLNVPHTRYLAVSYSSPLYIMLYDW